MANSYSLEEIWSGTFNFLTIHFFRRHGDGQLPTLRRDLLFALEGEGMAASLFFTRSQEVEVSI